MSYCSKCIIPITRPETFFNENICNACISYEQRKNIDWKKRWKIFIEKIEEIKKKKSFWVELYNSFKWRQR